MKSHLQKLPPMAANLRRDDDDRRRQTTTDDDRRRQTTRDDERRRHDARHANTAPTPRPPTINGNPSLRIREKEHMGYPGSILQPTTGALVLHLLRDSIPTTRISNWAMKRWVTHSYSTSTSTTQNGLWCILFYRFPLRNCYSSQ